MTANQEKSVASDGEGDQVEDHAPDLVPDNVPCLLSKRWTFTYGFYLTLTILYINRINLSLAVVCMVDFTSDHVPHLILEGSSPENGTVFIAVDTLYNDSTGTLYNVTRTEGQLNDSLQHGTNAGKGNGTAQHDIVGNKTDTIQQDNSCRDDFGSPVKDLKWQPELQWTKGQVSLLLSCYSYGSVLTQIPGGVLAEKFGGKHVITVSMVITCICAFLTPVLSIVGHAEGG